MSPSLTLEVDVLRRRISELEEQLGKRLQAATAQGVPVPTHPAEAKLARLKAELKDFAYVASHDLQEPLRTIANYSELLMRRHAAELSPSAAEYVGFISSAVTRARALTGDLLAYSRAVNLAMTPMGRVNPAAAIQWAVMNLQKEIQESGAAVRYDALPELCGDQMQLAQVFQNLIDNAIKFRSAEAPLIRISAGRQGDEWVFAITDNGIGIAPEYHERIFGVFKRLHSRDVPGTGMGLAICRTIVEHHGGRIWVESTEGQGATFLFTIPE